MPTCMRGGDGWLLVPEMLCIFLYHNLSTLARLVWVRTNSQSNMHKIRILVVVYLDIGLLSTNYY